MPNKQQERQSPEEKVKEYIERAEKIIDEKYSSDFAPESLIIAIAQMLQREEHFNKTK